MLTEKILNRCKSESAQNFRLEGIARKAPEERVGGGALLIVLGERLRDELRHASNFKFLDAKHDAGGGHEWLAEDHSGTGDDGAQHVALHDRHLGDRLAGFQRMD